MLNKCAFIFGKCEGRTLFAIELPYKSQYHPCGQQIPGNLFESDVRVNVLCTHVYLGFFVVVLL